MTINLTAPGGRGRPARLTNTLQSLPSGNSTEDFSLALPAPGQVRVRRLVHRGAPRPTTKVPSVLLGRIVQCESALEADLASILDACPGVVWFAEQPAVIRFKFDGASTSHVPDFAVATVAGCEFVEVKFEKDANDDAMERTMRLTALLRPYGVGYRLVTERHIRTQPMLGNARQLLIRGRETVEPTWALRMQEAVRRRGSIRLAEFGWKEPGSFEAGGVARLILDACLHLDMRAEISPATQVYIAPILNEENLLWQPVASK